MRPVIMALGRYGDILNAMPIAYREHLRGDRPIMFVAREFESLMDGFSYCDRLIWDGRYNRPDMAWHWLQNNFRGNRLINAQAYRHPTDSSRLTASYQIESWRHAGLQGDFSAWPLVVDRRSAAREAALTEPHVRSGKPIILVGASGVSSPFAGRDRLMETIRINFESSHQIVDLSGITAERPYDLLGLYDVASLLVSTDTLHLHLARASRVPVISLVNNGWFGSVPPPTSVFSVRYYDFDRELDRLVDVMCMALAAGDCREITHVVDNHGDSERHEAARRSWMDQRLTVPIERLYRVNWGRTDADVGGSRGTPFLTDLLGAALTTANPMGVVVWNNSDIELDPDDLTIISQHCAQWGALTMRRDEQARGRFPHMGRELFAFTVPWLRKHLSTFPDFLLGSPCFDLVVAAIVRRSFGINTVKDNLCLDLFPAEISRRVTHQPHRSAWAGEHEDKLPGNVYNRQLARAWCEANMPQLCL